MLWIGSGISPAVSMSETHLRGTANGRCKKFRELGLMVGLEITEDVYLKDIRSQTTCGPKIKSFTTFFLIIGPGAIVSQSWLKRAKPFFFINWLAQAFLPVRENWLLNLKCRLLPQRAMVGDIQWPQGANWSSWEVHYVKTVDKRVVDLHRLLSFRREKASCY